MKASELRIGNYVYGKEIENVKAIGIEGYIWFDYKRNLLVEHCQPIQLTEEWLLKFGFKAWDDKKIIYILERDIDKYNNDCFRFWFQLDKLVFDYIQNEIHPTESIFDDKNIIRLDIKHVHTLQNLYFALTNEELTFKSEYNE
jgi:hypothetical protein